MAFFITSTELQFIRVEVFWLSLVGVWLLYGLLAFWLSQRSWHWFISFALLAVAVSTLRIIEAGDLMLMQLANCLTVFFVFTGRNRMMGLKEARQKVEDANKHHDLSALKSTMSLANLLLVVAAAAIVFSLLNIDLTDLEPRSYSIGFGFAVGFAFVFGFAVASVSRWWAVLATLPLGAFGIYCAYYWIFPVKTKSSLFAAIFGTSFIWSELELFARAVLVTVAIAGWTIGLIHRMKRQSKSKASLVTRVAAVSIGVVFCLLAIGLIDVGSKLAHQYSNPESSQQKVSLELRKLVDRFATSQVFDSYPPADEVTLRREITAFSDEFSMLKEVLDSNENTWMPRDFDTEKALEEVQKVRAVARTLSTKARLEFADGNCDQSLTDSILIVQLRKPLSDKMTLLSELVAIAVEGIGHFSAAESIGSTSRSATDEALQRLLELDAKVYDPDLIYKIDQEIYWNGVTWWVRLAMLCDQKNSREGFERNTMEAIRRVQATRQQLIAMLALELYRHDHGKFPEELEALVPRYLPLVPHDPFQSENRDCPLRYKQLDNGKDYLLYSIGLDRNDDEGRVSEEGYGTPDEPGEDLNFKEAARRQLIEQDQELQEAAKAAEESDVDE